jgi:hypothetical protein
MRCILMMICYCLIQEGQLSQDNVSSLEKGIENIVEEHLASGVKQSWVVILNRPVFVRISPS